MTWYNPLGWFKSISQTDTELILYCDNPQCKSPITEEPIAHNAEHKEIYHTGECGLTANAHRAFRSGDVVFGSVDYINRKEALKLLKKGKLNNQTLEEKL